MNIKLIIEQEYDKIIDVIDPPLISKNNGENKKLYSINILLHISQGLISYLLNDEKLDKDFVELYLKGLYKYKDYDIFITKSKYKNTIGTNERINKNQFYLSGYLYCYDIDDSKLKNILLDFINNKISDFNNEYNITLNDLKYSSFDIEEYDKPDKYEIIKKYFK
jgi:hypothetical protein